ncbi:hypothetical protein VE00_06322 [Pseudogymnoascus sp. WSF 3629]|nr:hypothetical protein VE00_06322 [Pseudogymnoascus sp. WSF 3629]
MLRACCRPRAGVRIVSYVLPNSGSSTIASFGLTRRTLAGLPTGSATDALLSSAETAGGASPIGANELPWMKQFKETLQRHESPSLSNLATIVKFPDNDSIGKSVRVQGALGNVRNVSGKMSFVPLSDGAATIQLISLRDNSPDAHKILKAARANTPVEVVGTLQWKNVKPTKDGKQEPPREYELLIKSVQSLNDFPADILLGEDATYGPELRHLQIRFDETLKKRLIFRSEVLKGIRTALPDFHEVETPILFKSTPEGAREFLVPSRTSGHAYALPQSPQQYKQVLMASGINRYFQVARCFRDEDLRADRQPEFTQLDMEMAFTNADGVRKRMESFIVDMWKLRQKLWAGSDSDVPSAPFMRMTYDNAMRFHGVDKPDLRIKDLTYRVESVVPDNLKSMITSLEDPIVDIFKINLNCSPRQVGAFVKTIMDSPEMRPFHDNPDGGPGVFIYDPMKPLEGLAAFGHEGLESIRAFYGAGVEEPASSEDQAIVDKIMAATNEASAEDPTPTTETNTWSPPSTREPLEQGDIIILQARPRDVKLSGGSTPLGRLRSHIHKAAIAADLIDPDPSFNFLWIVDFPLFTPSNTTDPGQGGTAGFSSTHHPFTSPKTPADVDLLHSDPLRVVADHFDLVLNGVELGGGSRRIHNAQMQEWIMREALRMPEARLADFKHLFEALRAGCPPHAGMALGLDRMVAVMTGTESIRDVIAFPKNNRGEDVMVGSPSVMTEGQLATYQLAVVGKGGEGR